MHVYSMCLLVVYIHLIFQWTKSPVASQYMMTSSNGNIFRVTGPLCGEFTGPLICVWINGWVNNHKAGDLRRHRGYYEVNVMRNYHLPHASVVTAVGLHHGCICADPFHRQGINSRDIDHSKYTCRCLLTNDFNSSAFVVGDDIKCE